MRARLITGLTIGFMLLAASPALAQAISVSSFQLVGGGRVLAQRNYDLTVSGDVRLAFRGDPGAGCAAHGVCGYSGTAIWKPAASASVSLVVVRSGHRTYYNGFSDFNDAAGTAGEVVHRTVAEGPARGCADASTPESPLTLTTHASTVTLAPDVTIASRCAGPLGADLAAAAPQTTLPASAFTRPRLRLDLSGTRAFAAHGFTGTLISTVVVAGRKQRPQRNGGPPPPPPPGHRHRVRFVIESLTLVHASGTMQALISGAPDVTVCSVLDSCGAQGAITWAFMPRSPTGWLYALGPATLPLTAYRVALGLEPGRADRHISIFGGVNWAERGRMNESITQAGASCTDTAAAGDGFVVLGVTAHALHASYGAGTDGRTRCPGPELSQSTSPVLSGTIVLSRTERQFSLHLAGRATQTDDGYELRQSGSLTLTIRRGHLTQRVETF